MTLAVLCIIALVFYFMGMMFGPEVNQEEDKDLIDKVSQGNKPTEENEMTNV